MKFNMFLLQVKEDKGKKLQNVVEQNHLVPANKSCQLHSLGFPVTEEHALFRPQCCLVSKEDPSDSLPQGTLIPHSFNIVGKCTTNNCDLSKATQWASWLTKDVNLTHSCLRLHPLNQTDHEAVNNLRAVSRCCCVWVSVLPWTAMQVKNKAFFNFLAV